MALIAILLPRDEMLEHAYQMTQRHNLDVLEIASVHTSTALSKAKEMAAAGASIIIARGVQAMVIKENTSLPVVEIQLTGQEMGLLVTKAKRITGKPTPHIGIVGFENMFCDMSCFNDMLGVRLTTHFVESSDALTTAAEDVIAAGVDILIGGDSVCGYATEHQVPSVFISSTDESLNEACRIAKHIADAIDIEKRNTAEFKAILDYTINGIIQLDGNGVVHHMNHAAEQMVGIMEQNAIGGDIATIIPNITNALLAPVLSNGEEVYSVPVELGSTTFLASITPVLMDGRTTGAIICMGKQLELYTAERRKELILLGYTATNTFDEMVCRSEQMQAVLEQARRFAQFNMPMLLLGEFGTEKEELAQCIHNASVYADNAFVSINCGGYAPDECELRLFGGPSTQGLIDKAQGMIFLNEISRLSLSAQYKVYRLISRQYTSSYGGVLPQGVMIRVLAADSHDLPSLVRRGEFREDLYYALSVMTLYIPPLRNRREDISCWAEYFLQELQSFHGRYIHLTKGAWQLLHDWDWDGNLAQLRNLCERLIVTAPRRNVDEVFLLKQLRDTWPAVRRENEDAATQDPKAQRIIELMQLYNGSRLSVAKAMGISTTTLWRYMKKYEIESKG